ncbi:hypothetical protein [Shewanella sp. T24-MNA-CIBAN-0130]|uniref:hypothetical protein n=1 Tax=Shewanella sp. T24-MNA-CIBAN-0130 TaxID=3140470 RepID=UPI0033204B2C
MNLPEKDFPVTKTLSKLERTLLGLEKTEELHYLNFLTRQYGFRISNDWAKTRKQIAEDILNPSSIRPEVTEDRLVELVDQLIVSCDHSYRIYSITPEAIKSIQALPKKLTNDMYSQQLSSIYPDRLSSSSTNASGVGLTKVKTFDSGLAFIFSLVNVVTKYNPELSSLVKSTTQTFNTVFIPNNSNRIEVRVSNQVKKNDRDDCFRDILDNFRNLTGSLGVNLKDINQLSFYNAIDSYYLDANAGRAASTTMTTTENSNDAVLSNFRNRNYCARTQSVQDNTEDKHTYKCRAVSVRWPLEKENRCETEVSITPHKHSWELKNCFTFELKHPSSLLQLNRLVNDVIKRSE